MTLHHGDATVFDEIPAADAAEQHRPADPSVEDMELDTDQVARVLDVDADPADVFDQAIIVPLPDGDRGVETTES
ncbi:MULTISPECIES: hypothetical protein [Mycobacteriaceae]|uniref:Uncharacterized protein n=1 Tax=Mycolicibacterium austroafricanum TaxID=39687 RepID=A0ABT8H8Z6_MYCAO|nr:MULTISPECIES: hypothetical protein [Mycobacteriaceae]MDN4517240.1 hypothetical protein [Mycolicibacterium austroafricanum]